MKEAIITMLTLAINNATEAINQAHGRIQAAEQTIEEANTIIIQAGDQRDEAQALLEIILEVLGPNDTDNVEETPGMQQAIIANVEHELNDENTENNNIINENLANHTHQPQLRYKGKAGEKYRTILAILDDGKARTSREINAALHRPPNKRQRDSISYALRQLAQDGHVHDTGLTTMREGLGGPPQKLWARPKTSPTNTPE